MVRTWVTLAFALVLALAWTESARAAQPRPDEKRSINNPVNYRGDGYDHGYFKMKAELEALEAAEKEDERRMYEGIETWLKVNRNVFIGAGVAFLLFLFWLFRR